jgi:hypothetical protein
VKKSWLQGLTPEESEEMKRDYGSAANFREHMTHILQDKIESSSRAGRSKEGYDSPNWAYLQADLCGYHRALTEVISLIENEKQ